MAGADPPKPVRRDSTRRRIAELSYATGRRPAELLDLDDWEIELLYEHLPEHYGREHYGMAQILTDLREFMSPRYTEPDPDADQSKPERPPRARNWWRVEENLPPFAVNPVPRPELSDPARDALARHWQDLPEWATAAVRDRFGWQPN